VESNPPEFQTDDRLRNVQHVDTYWAAFTVSAHGGDDHNDEDDKEEGKEGEKKSRRVITW
jgi:hypothetical protein